MSWSPPGDTGQTLIPGLHGYTDLQLIAHGSTAMVFRANQIRLNRTVAIKVLLVDDVMTTAANVARELETTVKLSSQPHIVSIIDTGVTDDGSPYIVMEYCEGGSYAQILKRRGPLPVDEVLEVGIKIGEALHAAHEVGIIHRDVKPPNILRSRFGPALTDFGIARAADDGGIATSTLDKLTPQHASPEAMLRGHQSGLSDLYSLASTMWNLLIGRAPFADPSQPYLDPIAFRQRVLDEPAPRVPRDDLPEWLQHELARAMSKTPEDRHASAGEFAETLRLHGSRSAMPSQPIVPPPVAAPVESAAPATVVNPPVTPPPVAAPPPVAQSPVTPPPLVWPSSEPVRVGHDAAHDPEAPLTEVLAPPPQPEAETPQTPLPDVSSPTETPPGPTVIGSPDWPEPYRIPDSTSPAPAHPQPAPPPAQPPRETLLHPHATPPVSAPPSTAFPVSAPPVSAPPVSTPPYTPAPPVSGPPHTQAPPVSGYTPHVPGPQQVSAPPVPGYTPGYEYGPPATPAPAPPRRKRRSYTKPLMAAGALGISLGLAATIGVIAVRNNKANPDNTPDPSPTALNPDGEVDLTTQGAPRDLKIEDDGTSVTLRWTDATAGKAPFIIIGARDGQTAKALGKAERGETSRVINGLTPRADYCFVVAAALSVDTLAKSEPACTSRLGANAPESTPSS